MMNRRTNKRTFIFLAFAAVLAMALIVQEYGFILGCDLADNHQDIHMKVFIFDLDVTPSLTEIGA